MVCAYDGTAAEAYCSYDVGPKACARCTKPIAARPVARCGTREEHCTFWLEGTPRVNATLSKTGSCAQTCNTTLVLKVKGIVNIAEETFHDMPKLKELTLEENSLARLPADIFKKNTELETLYLRNNQLRAIPADIFRYNTKLVKLYLEHNAITKIEAETFQNNTKLELLILSNNRLTRIDSNTFKTNLELRELHLAGNAITSLEADTFKYNIKLEALAMGPNPLGCVVRPASVIHFGTEPLPECPDNCTVNTYYDADANVCLACPDGTFTDGVGAVNCTAGAGTSPVSVYAYCYAHITTLCIQDCC